MTWGVRTTTCRRDVWRRLAFLLAAVLLLSGGSGWAGVPPAEAERGARAGQRPRDDGYADQAKGQRSCPHGMKNIAVGGTVLCTTGPDLKPPSVRIEQAQARNARTDSRERTVACIDDGVSGPRIEALYVHDEAKPSRYEETRPSIQAWVADVDRIIQESAAQTGGKRRLRVVTDILCQPEVREVAVPGKALETFGATILAVRGEGFDSPSRNYLMFVDANVYCGIGTTRGDSRPGPDNLNNQGGGYARVDRGCWTGVVAAHETMHTLGAVQLDAPNSTGSWHCTDDRDIMCYQDGGAQHRPAEQVCTEGVWARSQLFDCNGDDYFNTNPADRSYPATHWNVANSAFLDAPRSESERTPAISLSLTTGSPGLSVRASLTGFPSGKPVRLLFGDVELAAGKANRQGKAALSFAVPVTPGGEYRVEAAGAGTAARTGFAVQPAIAFDPSEAAPGEEVTALGAGFGAGEDVTLEVDGAPVAAAVARDDGTLEASFVQPADDEAGAHVHVVFARGSSGHAASASLLVARESAGSRAGAGMGRPDAGVRGGSGPAVELSLGSGMPGDWVRAEVSGLPPGKPAKLRFGGEVMTGGTTDRRGEATLRFRVLPRPGGEYPVTVESGGVTVETSFRLEAALAVEAKRVSPGRPTKARLVGFGADERVRLTIDGTEVGAGRTGPDGQLRIVVAVPAELAAGAPLLHAEGDAGSHASAPLRVKEPRRGRGRIKESERTPTPAVAQGRISLSLSRGAPGTTIRASLERFPDGEQVRIVFDGTEVARVRVNHGGNGSVAFEVPGLPRGDHALTAEPGGSGAAAFRIEPALDFEAREIAPGKRVDVRAEGFGAGERIAFTIGGEELDTATADGRGSARVELILPDDLPGGSPVLVAEGNDGGRATVSLRTRDGGRHRR